MMMMTMEQKVGDTIRQRHGNVCQEGFDGDSWSLVCRVLLLSTSSSLVPFFLDRGKKWRRCCLVRILYLARLFHQKNSFPPPPKTVVWHISHMIQRRNSISTDSSVIFFRWPVFAITLIVTLIKLLVLLGITNKNCWQPFVQYAAWDESK